MLACFYLVISTKHKVQLSLMEMSLVLQVFSRKPNWTNRHFDQIQTKDQISKVVVGFILWGS